MKRDIDNLRRIVEYCEYVEEDIARFGDDIEDLMNDRTYQRSTAKCIEEIGEAAKKLTTAVTSKYLDVSWPDICGIRDIMVHQYEAVNLTIQWDTMTMDLPFLKTYCLRIIADLESDTDAQRTF